MKVKVQRTILLISAVVFLVFFAYGIYRVRDALIIGKTEQATFDGLAAVVAEYSWEDDVNKDAHEILSRYLPLHEQNSDLFGWIFIKDTPIDYPVMYTPADSQYYIHRDFYGGYTFSGTPFIDGDCPADGNHYIVYAHHMKNGTMFGMLPKYGNKTYYEKHPSIYFDTLYEYREYEVMAAFYTEISEDDDTDSFKYYEYTDLSNPEVFDAYVAGVKAASVYDTGVTAEYGDELLTLSTCNYHAENGRFVVTAKRVR